MPWWAQIVNWILFIICVSVIIYTFCKKQIWWIYIVTLLTQIRLCFSHFAAGQILTSDDPRAAIFKNG